MYWLILIAGLAAGSAQSQSIATDLFQMLEPDYRKGYERPDPHGIDWQSNPVPIGPLPGIWNPDPQEGNGGEPIYRFRGDPPSGAAQPAEGELRFRPLSPRERERMGPSMRWRPLDAERRGVDEPPPQTLFDTLAPGRANVPSDVWPR
ncbi:hypothetical protein GWK36_10275 [Caldichromatium japonicum]|uniref:Uncharacterized protein n=1 Tax=Caldichromatium japonicum TaxID=2699430 RepID=A0A6G7VEG4_9GAMM|nr:hypothetical protein [Caldichromatium japonicum]QIK38300.1 hypothetical protein GWK36_10275 [Caldichromatium japonicum]